MNSHFLKRLHELTEEAYKAITEFIKEKGIVILITEDDIEQNEKATTDIYDMPDFPHYDKYNYVQHCAIKEIKLDGDNICISGICKGDNYPDTVITTLCELEGHCAIVLADYLYNDWEEK